MDKDKCSPLLWHLLLKKEKEAGDQVYLRQPRNGVWHEFTWAQVMLQARKVAAFLQARDLKKGSHVAIISKNCAEWFMTDFGITLAGMVSLPLFANQHCESIHYVLEQGDVSFIFLGKLDEPQKVRHFIPAHYPTAAFDYHKDLQVDYPWSEIMEMQPLDDLLEPNPQDLHTIIYTSGTAGLPKGAMYTHQAIANYLSVFSKDLLRLRDLEVYHLISYLPLAHVYERSVIQFGSLVAQATVSFIESLDKFTQNLHEVHPSFFTAVPRIWGLFQQKIEQKLSFKKLNFLLKIPLISGLVKKRIRAHLGFARCTNFFSGASFLPKPINDFFDKLGVPIQDGYGQTENLAYVTVSLSKDRKNGCVGTPRVGVQVKLDEGNELLVHSPCLMSGYYKDPELSARVFTKDGWLRTGDIAEIDSGKHVKILGRISESYKNQAGEFVVPTPIEKLFSSSPVIEQLCLVGQGLSTNVLLVVLNERATRTMDKSQIKKLLQEQLHQVNSQLMKHEKISPILIVQSPWTIENTVLTPTLKVKRRVVEQMYRDLIHQVIREGSPVVWEPRLCEQVGPIID